VQHLWDDIIRKVCADIIVQPWSVNAVLGCPKIIIRFLDGRLDGFPVNRALRQMRKSDLDRMVKEADSPGFIFQLAIPASVSPISFQKRYMPYDVEYMRMFG
jgi:hypothetical protein